MKTLINIIFYATAFVFSMWNTLHCFRGFIEEPTDIIAIFVGISVLISTIPLTFFIQQLLEFTKEEE